MYGLDGTVITVRESISIQEKDSQTNSWVSEFVCEKLLEDDHRGYKAGEFTYYHNGIWDVCLDEDGMIDVKREILNTDTAGTYYLVLSHYHGNENLDRLKSNSFTIK